MKFLLEITPVDAEDVREEFLDGDLDEPEFTYRELEAEPDVVAAELDAIDVRSVEDPTLAHLLRAKHREMELQLEMLRARDSDGFLGLEHRAVWRSLARSSRPSSSASWSAR